ncbi:B3 domain-containing protein Os04g0386900-like [Ananas comosus]|uniref:B3 domain-containing protein Os04g0386900-like n=1 Tax=Ananas comosus TaxID=4615 RepID=A0A6P5HPL0_ANACO|nr:B3 domain-containing protein Os04g0386900-like [Ananas comosus]
MSQVPAFSYSNADPCNSDIRRSSHRTAATENSFSSQESTNHATATEDDSGPLLGKPFFTAILTKSQVQSPYQMAIPAKFYKFLPATCAPATLSCGSSSWKVNYIGDRGFRRFDSDWKHFATDSKLRVGDALVFELVDEAKLKFRVRILRGDVPEMFAAGGDSSDSPIVID